MLRNVPIDAVYFNYKHTDERMNTRFLGFSCIILSTIQTYKCWFPWANNNLPPSKSGKKTLYFTEIFYDTDPGYITSYKLFTNHLYIPQ